MVIDVAERANTPEKLREVQRLLLNEGYFTHEYVLPARTVETTVPCPNCNEHLNLYRAGTSYRIYCLTTNCFDIGARGL